MQINWSDPVFGSVIEKHRSWYLSTSGTIWSGGRWVVDGGRFEERTITRKGTEIKWKYYAANKFQDDMTIAKEKIREHMENKGIINYIVSNDNIFDTMRRQPTEIKYVWRNMDMIEKFHDTIKKI